MPSWLRPPRGPYGELTVPLTGVEIVAELHEPLAGACVVGSCGRRGARGRRGVHRRRRRSFRHRCRPALPVRCPPAAAFVRPSAAPAAARSSRPATRPLAPASANSEDHVLGPTMPSTSRPAESWYLRTAASVCGPKMPSEATPSLVCTCATRSPWLPTRSGRPPSRISIALLAGDSAATAALTSPETWAAAMGAPGPTTTAVASAADTCFLRLFSRRAFGSSARLRRDRSSERSQSSGAARSRWAFVIHVPFLSGLRG